MHHQHPLDLQNLIYCILCIHLLQQIVQPGIDLYKHLFFLLLIIFLMSLFSNLLLHLSDIKCYLFYERYELLFAAKAGKIELKGGTCDRKSGLSALQERKIRHVTKYKHQ
jgi:hypothetical protein